MRAKFSLSVDPATCDGADALRFLQRLLRPGAGDDVVGGRARREQVHRHHRELQRRAALQEQHLVRRRNVAERAQVGLGPREDVLEGLRAVADLEDRHADARAARRDRAALLRAPETGRTAGPAEKLKMR